MNTFEFSLLQGREGRLRPNAAGNAYKLYTAFSWTIPAQLPDNGAALSARTLLAEIASVVSSSRMRSTV
jgi:hypothetical protein